MINTTDFKTSKALTDALEGAGYEYKSAFIIDRMKGVMVNDTGRRFTSSAFEFGTGAAYTMGELWQMLPKKINVKEFDLGDCWYLEQYGYVSYTNGERESRSAVHFEIYDNPCNALAQLAIWCIDNGHELNCTRINTPTNQK